MHTELLSGYRDYGFFDNKRLQNIAQSISLPGPDSRMRLDLVKIIGCRKFVDSQN
jgi:hypothetical protein